MIRRAPAVVALPLVLLLASGSGRQEVAAASWVPGTREVAMEVEVSGDIHAPAGDIHAASGDTHAASGDIHAASGDIHAPSGDTLTPAATPFGPGEQMEYQVKLGIANVGNGHMTVHGIDTIRGHPAYHVSMGIRGGLRFVARVDNTLESWMDVHTLASHRFIQDQDEIRTQRYRQFDFFHDTRRFVRADGEEQGTMITNRPLDDISFVYYARTLPLEVGRTYTLNQYFRPDRNPVVLQVLRRDRVQVPAGTFNTIVVRPIIRTRGIFSEGGEAEIHFTDDDRRIMVYMQSRVPGMNLTLHLRDYTPGRPLRPLRTQATQPRTP